jgi:hypothetical protein
MDYIMSITLPALYSLTLIVAPRFIWRLERLGASATWSAFAFGTPPRASRLGRTGCSQPTAERHRSCRGVRSTELAIPLAEMRHTSPLALQRDAHPPFLLCVRPLDSSIGQQAEKISMRGFRDLSPKAPLTPLSSSP